VPISLVLDAATVRVLHLTRRLDADEEERSELFHRVQRGTGLVLTKRPVANVSAEGSGYGSEFGAIAVDLVDPELGLILLTGPDLGWWPPSSSRSPYTRWRDFTWPIISVTYDVTGSGHAHDETQVEADLRDGTAALAAYWYDQHISGAKEDVAVGQIRQKLMHDPEPPWLLRTLARHLDTASHARWV
jgi:hypothetical protein